MNWLAWLTTQILGIEQTFADELYGHLISKGGEQVGQLFGSEFRRTEESAREPRIVNGVAYVGLVGVLTESMSWPGMATSYADFSAAMLVAAESDAKSITILVNSPGGTMAGCPEASDLVYSLRGQKPITAVAVNGMMCSAAYYVASGADRIESTVGARIGSIGVLLINREYSAMDALQGTTTKLMRRPRLKAIGNQYEPLSKEAEAALMGTVVNPAYEMMVGRIARNRGVSAETIEANYGQGLTLMTPEALAAGLIDAVVSWPPVEETQTPDPLARSAGARGETATGTAATLPDAQTGRPPAVPIKPILKEADPVKYSPKFRAWLFANDLIAAMDTSDELIAALLAGWFGAQAKAMPKDEAGIFAALKEHAKPAAATVPATVPAVLTPAASAVPLITQADLDAAAERAVVAQELRRTGILRRAELLGLEAADPQVVAALANRQLSPAAFAAAVCDAAEASNKPLTVRENLTAGPAQADKFAEAAVYALLLRNEQTFTAIATADGNTTPAEAKASLAKLCKDNPMVREVASMPWQQIMHAVVDGSGERMTEKSETAYAQAFVRLQGQEERVFAQGHPRLDQFGLMASAGAGTGPGDYPGIMDGIMRKIVEYALSVAPVTYPAWCSRLPDAINFQPEELRELGYRGDLPEHKDAEDYDQSFAPPGTLGFLQVAEYGREFPVSWRTMLSDPMDYLIQGLGQDQIAHERTLNALCVNLLIGGISPITGLGIWDGSHNNTISSGAGPTLAQGKAMRKLMQQQKLVTDPTREAGLDLCCVLVGSNWWTDAQVCFLDVTRLNYMPITQDTVNPLRGVVTPHYEPLLSTAATGSGNYWYGCANPASFVKGIRYRFLGGFGPGGRRDAYYDSKKLCQWYRIRGAFGAVLHHHEVFCRNVGA